MAGRTIKVNIVGDADSLKRTYGAAAVATESLGGKIAKLGKVAALAAGAAGLGALFVTLRTGLGEWEESAKVAAQTEAVLKSTGATANVTAQQVDDLATSIMEYSGIDDEAVKSGENLLLTFTNIRNEVGKGNDIFNQATKAAVDLSVAFGKDMAGSAILVGKALNDPVKGISALTRVGVTFTEGQKKAIKAMVDTGNVMGAQKVILKELAKETGGSAKALGQTLPGQLAIAREKFNNFAGALVGKVIPALLDVFGWFGKVGKEFAKAKGFTAKLTVVWTNIREVAVSLAQKLNEFFWSGWTEQIGRSGGPQMGVAKIHEGLLSGLRDVDWGEVGRAILDGIVSGLQAAGRIAEKLSAIVSETVGRIDWGALGAKMGPLLATALAAGFVTITDPSFWVKHWQLALAVAIAVFPIGKLAGLAAKIGTELVLAATKGVEKFAPALAKGILDGIVLAGRAMEKLGSLLSPIISRAGAVLEAVAKKVFGKLSQVATFVVKVLGIQAVIAALTNLAVTAYNKAKKIGSNIVDGIVDGAKFLYQKVKGALDSLWKLITNVAGTALRAAVAIGTGIIEGIISGLSGLVSRVAGAIQDKVTSAISAAWDFLTGSPEVKAALPIGKGIALAIYKGFIDEMPETKNKIKLAAQQAAAAAKTAELLALAQQAGQLLGMGTATGILKGIIGMQPSIKQQYRIAVIEQLNSLIGEARDKFASVFGSFADAATNAFNAKIAAWKSPSQMILDKLALEKTLSSIGDTLGPAAETLMEKIGAALAKGNVKLATRLEAELNGIIATALAGAQTDLAAAKAGLAAAEATGDPEAIAKAQEAVTAAQKNFDDITTAQQTALTLLAAQETAAHDKKVAADQKRFAEDLARLNNALDDQNKSVREKHNLILQFLQREGLGGKVAAELRGKIKAVEEAADALAKAIKDRLSFTTTVTVEVVTKNVPPGGIPGKALGGHVFAGQPYIVGERGPELFLPGASGNIIPNGATAVASAGGYGTVHVHVGTVIGNDLEGAARELAGPLRRELTRHAQRNR